MSGRMGQSMSKVPVKLPSLLMVGRGEAGGVTAPEWLCARVAHRFLLCLAHAERSAGTVWSTGLSSL